MQRTQRQPSRGREEDRAADQAADCFLALDAHYVVTWAAQGSDQGPAIGTALSALCPETLVEAWLAYRRCMEERVAVQFVGPCPLTREVCAIAAYPHASGGISIFSRPQLAPARERESAVMAAAPGASRPRDVLAALLAHLPDAAYLADEDGLHALNQSALTLAGYASASELPSDFATLARELNVRDASSRAPLTSEQLPWSRAARGEGHVQELVWRPRLAASDRIVCVTAAPVSLKAERAAVLCLVSDMTEQRAAAADDKARAEFEQKLIGIVSHDLRNPLQVIRFASSIGLSAAQSDARQARHFERIRDASARALRMVDDLLDFTSIRFTGALRIEPKHVDAHALAEQTVNELLSTHPGRHVQVEAVGDGTGHWDPDRLLQILQNLVSNALQHTTEDTPVRVTTRGEDQYVVLEVHNGGPPIPKEEHRRLFEPFQRGGGTQPRSGRSMGLGLYITSHLAQAHGGTVRLASSAESGTTFTVRLPRGAAQAPIENGHG